MLENEAVLFWLKVATYITFLFIGILGFIKKEEDNNTEKESFIQKLSHTSLNYIIIVAVSIFVGELGDKTLIASLGLGLEYPSYKITLIVGCILGMVVSNFIAILFGRWISQKVSNKYISIVSNLIFIAFGLIGILGIF